VGYQTIHISKCAQMDPQQLPKMTKLYSLCNKCVCRRT